MTHVQFTDRRFDPDLTPIHDIAKSMAQAVGYTADLALDGSVAQLIRLRVAQRNQCSYCLLLHSRAARDQGIPGPKIDGLGSWQESDLFTPAEKSALCYSDALTDGDRPGFQAIHDDVRRYFSAKEAAELAAVVINMNLWTRLKLAQGAVPEFSKS